MPAGDAGPSPARGVLDCTISAALPKSYPRLTVRYRVKIQSSPGGWK